MAPSPPTATSRRKKRRKHKEKRPEESLFIFLGTGRGGRGGAQMGPVGDLPTGDSTTRDSGGGHHHPSMVEPDRVPDCLCPRREEDIGGLDPTRPAPRLALTLPGCGSAAACGSFGSGPAVRGLIVRLQSLLRLVGRLQVTLPRLISRLRVPPLRLSVGWRLSQLWLPRHLLQLYPPSHLCHSPLHLPLRLSWCPHLLPPRFLCQYLRLSPRPLCGPLWVCPSVCL